MKNIISILFPGSLRLKKDCIIEIAIELLKIEKYKLSKMTSEEIEKYILDYYNGDGIFRIERYGYFTPYNKYYAQSIYKTMCITRPNLITNSTLQKIKHELRLLLI